MRQVELVVIGGGSAGLAAAISAYDQGVRDILILEREQELGGILQQCIHSGFGVHTFKEELTGPAFAQRFIDLIEQDQIQYKLNTMVIHMDQLKRIEYVNPQEGYIQIQAKAIVLAMGCRERTRGAIAIPGQRPAGIWSAGTAQRYLNMEGYMVGKSVFILGSGDIGLIMARRLSLEGAQVKGVAEIMPYSNGLPRNVKQCLDDFEIPLFLSHTITHIEGQDRVKSVTIQAVDDKFKPIPGSQQKFDVDTVLFSIGLIPENALSEEAQLDMDNKTRGPKVDESYQTSISGIFACGNVLHVHDLVDFVAQEGTQAGLAAAKYLKDQLIKKETFTTEAHNGISYIVPQKVCIANLDHRVELLFRVKKIYKDSTLIVKKDGQVFKQFKKRHLAPAEMEKLVIPIEDLKDLKVNLSLEIVEENL
jgi:NADPH-dependent 2,4-dienoyl-CoA reductase/sulfur reductase-like enzyme